jgi:hypothetical protein
MIEYSPDTAEKAACDCISMNRMNLHRFLSEFQTSVALFELLERGGGPPSIGVFGGVFIQYRIIAARDGALNIFHFGCSLEAIKKQLPMCPSIAQRTDAVKLRNAVKQFNSDFPHADNVRNAIAHAGEVFSTPQKIKENEQKSDHKGVGFSSGAGGHLIGALYERTYTVSNHGFIFSVTLNADAIAKLANIILLVDAAFQVPVAQATQPREN